MSSNKRICWWKRCSLFVVICNGCIQRVLPRFQLFIILWFQFIIPHGPLGIRHTKFPLSFFVRLFADSFSSALLDIGWKAGRASIQQIHCGRFLFKQASITKLRPLNWSRTILGPIGGYIADLSNSCPLIITTGKRCREDCGRWSGQNR